MALVLVRRSLRLRCCVIRSPTAESNIVSFGVVSDYAVVSYGLLFGIVSDYAVVSYGLRPQSIIAH